MSDYDHRFNDLSDEEILSLMPYLIESQILHVKNCRLKALIAHRKLMDEYDSHIKSIQEVLETYRS